MKRVAKYGKHPSIAPNTMALMAFLSLEKKMDSRHFFKITHKKCDNFVTIYKKIIGSTELIQYYTRNGTNLFLLFY